MLPYQNLKRPESAALGLLPTAVHTHRSGSATRQFLLHVSQNTIDQVQPLNKTALSDHRSSLRSMSGQAHRKSPPCSQQVMRTTACLQDHVLGRRRSSHSQASSLNHSSSTSNQNPRKLSSCSHSSKGNQARKPRHPQSNGWGSV